MKHTAQYRLSNTQRAKRLEQFAEVSQPASLEGELSAARLLAEEAVNTGNTALANALLTTISRLASAHTSSLQRAGELLERPIVLKIGVALVNLVAEELQDKFTGWEASLERIATDLPATIVRLTDPALLTDERGAQ